MTITVNHQDYLFLDSIRYVLNHLIVCKAICIRYIWYNDYFPGKHAGSTQILCITSGNHWKCGVHSSKHRTSSIHLMCFKIQKRGTPHDAASIFISSEWLHLKTFTNVTIFYGPFVFQKIMILQKQSHEYIIGKCWHIITIK